MRSVRLDEDLDERVRRAAAVEGASVSEFIRRAVADRAERALTSDAQERLADVLGAVHAGGGQARDTGAAFTELVNRRRRTA
jgi:predicted transcriptional regulator